MDDQLQILYRQYLQQIAPTNVRLPPARWLLAPDVQDQIFRYFFDESQDVFLPPPPYQRRFLKRLVTEIERELATGKYDLQECAVSDALMSHMGTLSTLPPQLESDAAQEPRVLTYFVPWKHSPPGFQDGKLVLDSMWNRRIVIREAPNLLAAGSNVGFRTWEACLHLATYLCSRYSTESDGSKKNSINDREKLAIAGSSLIELGAGTGLLSLICALALQAKTVVCTDGLSHVIEGIHHNVALNNALAKETGSQLPLVKLLDWTEHLNCEETFKHGEGITKFDYILGADITYHPDLFEPLAATICHLLDWSPHAHVLISATVRNEATLLEFQTVCEKQYSLCIRHIPTTEWLPPSFRKQTGLFYEQAFPIVIMEIGRATK